jgi:hypothetical protein
MFELGSASIDMIPEKVWLLNEIPGWHGSDYCYRPQRNPQLFGP